jgi:hypothetical protein
LNKFSDYASIGALFSRRFGAKGYCPAGEYEVNLEIFRLKARCTDIETKLLLTTVFVEAY